jgi:hypothetical protein
MTDVYSVQVDASTIALVDAYANRSAFRPSRRQAVRALLRQALRAHEVRARTAVLAPTPEQQPGGAV